MRQPLFHPVGLILETVRPYSFFITQCSGPRIEWQCGFYELSTYPPHQTLITFSAKQSVLSFKQNINIFIKI